MPLRATSRTRISISGLTVGALTMVLVTCPYCGVNVRTDRLTAHVARRCQSAAEIRRHGRRGKEAFEFPPLLEACAEGSLGGRRKKRQKSSGRAEARPATHSSGIGKMNGGTQESDADQRNLKDWDFD
jgi:hypothetical protein